jgi:hypothetical protein
MLVLLLLLVLLQTGALVQKNHSATCDQLQPFEGAEPLVAGVYSSLWAGVGVVCGCATA